MSNEKVLSQFDLGLAIRDAHEKENSSLRLSSANTSVPPNYSRVELTHNSANSVVNAKFYKGTLSEIRHIIFKADVAGSLNNTYFPLYSENDEALYHIWYNVSGGGTDPVPAGSEGIEVEIETGDSAAVVKLATELNLKRISEFKLESLGSYKLKIENNRKGDATDTVDAGTGFIFELVQDGAEEFLKNIDLPFVNGQRYTFNEQEKRFEVEGGVNSDGSKNVNIVSTPSLNENIVLTYTEISSLASATLTTIASYTVPALKTSYLQRIEAGGENIANYQVEINATVKAKRRTYFGGPMTTDFIFAESTENGVELSSGDIVTIRVIHSRPTSADFEARIQVLELG